MTPYLLHTNIDGSGGSTAPAYLTEFNNELYFTADGGSGIRIWKYDGTNDLTVIDDDGMYNPTDLMVFNDALYFVADGAKLWKYDGTSASKVWEANVISNPRFLTEFNDALYFSATEEFLNQYSNGQELWKYDGTSASMVADINPGIAGSNPGGHPQSPKSLGKHYTVFQGSLYFSAKDGSPNGQELWKYDGNIASKVEYPMLNPWDITVFQGSLYFSADPYDGTGRELWTYDGTNLPTMVADINPNGDGSGMPKNFIEFNDALYFTADDGTNGEELWKYDGTNAPTMVADINPNGDGSVPRDLTVFKDALYFSATDLPQGRSLWKYEINELYSSAPDSPTGFELWGNADGSDGFKLWKKKTFSGSENSVWGMVAGTFYDMYPTALTVFNDALYFGAAVGNNGVELWKYVWL